MFPLVYAVERGEATCVWYRDLRFAFPGRGSEPFRFGMCRADDGGWTRYALDTVAGRAALR
jgi:hypothetical protein